MTEKEADAFLDMLEGVLTRLGYRVKDRNVSILSMTGDWFAELTACKDNEPLKFAFERIGGYHLDITAFKTEDLSIKLIFGAHIEGYSEEDIRGIIILGMTYLTGGIK